MRANESLRVWVLVAFVAACGAAGEEVEEGAPPSGPNDVNAGADIESEPGTLQEALNGCPNVCGSQRYSTSNLTGFCCRCDSNEFGSDYGRFYATPVANVYRCDLSASAGCYDSCTQPAANAAQTIGK